MKRLLIILLVLCPYVSYGPLYAQIYTTSSANYRSITTGVGSVNVPMQAFRSTSSYGRSMATTRTYSTAPLNVANGMVKTSASSLNGNLVQSDPDTNNGSVTTIPIIPGVPDTPLSTGWDVMIFLGILSILYIRYVRRRAKV